MDDNVTMKRVEATQKRKKRGRIVFFAVVAVIVLGIVLLAAYRDGTGFDVLGRYFHYGRVEDASGKTIYTYDDSDCNHFAMLGDHLVVLSDKSLRLLSKNGEDVWDTQIKMNHPALVSGGGRAAAYDVGGTELILLDERGEVKTLHRKKESPILSVTMNDAGWMAVTSQEHDYKGRVTVYNAQASQVFVFNSSRRFLMDACVTNDCKDLAAVTLGQENGTFISNIILYHLDQTKPYANYNIENGLAMTIDDHAGKLAAVSDTGVTFASPSGVVEGTYSYQNEYLHGYNLDGKNFVTVLLNHYQSNSVGRLVTIDSKGEELGSLEVNQEIQSISASGRYLAVLYMDTLVIYTPDLDVYASLQGIRSAKEVLMRPDGSALLLSEEEAKLFLP